MEQHELNSKKYQLSGWAIIRSLMLYIALGGGASAWAYDCTTIASGNWSSSAIWGNCGFLRTPGSGDTVTIDGDTVTLNTSPTVASLTVNGGTLRRNNNTSRSLAVNGAFTNNGSVIDSANSGTFSIAVGGSLTNNGSATLSVDNLTVAGNVVSSGALTVDSAMAVGGDLAVSGGVFSTTDLTFQKSGTQSAVFSPSSASIVGNLTVNNGSTVFSNAWSAFQITGDLTNNGNLSLANSTVTFSGNAIQSIDGNKDATLGFLVLNGAGITMSRNVMASKLTLTKGDVATGINSLNVSGTYCSEGAITGGSSSSHVVGNLRLKFPHYATTCVYPVGDGVVYAPITVEIPWFSNVAAMKDKTLTGKTVAGQHPQIATSGINSLLDVNRYWVLGATGDTLTVGSLPSGGSYNATFQFAVSDILGGGQVNSFSASRYTSSAWTSPVIPLSSYTPTTVSVVGMNAFGDYVTGKPGQANPGQCARPSFVPNGVTCYCDDFSGSNLSSGIFNAKWTVGSVGSREFTPRFSNGRLQLTDNRTAESTSATLGAIFPAAGNYISVEFRQFAYGGNGADGMALVLSDSNIPANPGAFGGSLGYAQKTGIKGFAGGWLGVGFDEYGNYLNATEGRSGGPGNSMNRVGVRGSYAAGDSSYLNGYSYLGRSGTLSSPSLGDSGGYYYQVIIDARNYNSGNKTATVQVNRNTTCTSDFCPSSYQAILNAFDTYAPGFTPITAQAAVPDYWQLSFTGSTGDLTNYHEIGGLRVCAQTILPPGSNTYATDFNAIDESLGSSPTDVQSGHIYTKLAGVPFAVNIAALKIPQAGAVSVNADYAKGGDKTVKVELIDNSDQDSVSCTAKIKVIATQNVVFKEANHGFLATSNFSVSSGYANVIVRMSEGSTTACSTDRFAIRPSLTLAATTSAAATLTNKSGGATGIPTVKAGDDFTLTAQLTTSTTPKFQGVPSVTGTVTDVVSNSDGSSSLDCLFSSFDPDSRVATAVACRYKEVGYFELKEGAVSDGGVFTSTVDQQQGNVDCVIGSASNVKNDKGKYGCNIGNSLVSFGRFIPHHFAFSATLTNRRELSDCTSEFSYMGESLGVELKLTAQNKGNGTTANYDFDKGYSRLTVGNWLTAGAPVLDSINLWALDSPAAPASKTIFPAAANRITFVDDHPIPPSDCSGTPFSRWCAGVANFSGGMVLARSSAPDGPYNNFAVGLAPYDLDGVTLSAFDLDADQSGTNERAKLATTSVRFGLLQLTTAYGSELLPLSVGMEARFWNGLAFVLNAQDNCTKIEPANIASARVAGDIAATLGAPTVIPIKAGKGSLRFASPGLRSTFRVCVDLGSDTNCSATGSAAMSYMTGRWDGSAAFDRDPSARAAFGLNRGAYLYYRENY